MSNLISMMLSQNLSRFKETMNDLQEKIKEPVDNNVLYTQYDLFHKMEKIIDVIVLKKTITDTQKTDFNQRKEILKNAKIDIISAGVYPSDPNLNLFSTTILAHLDVAIRAPSLLFLAIENSNDQYTSRGNILKLIVKFKKVIDKQQKNEEQETLLIMFCRKMRNWGQGLCSRQGYSIIEALLDIGVDPNAADSLGNSALLYICDSSLCIYSSYLLHKIIDFKYISSCIKEIISLLVEKNADINHKNHQGDTPFGIALEGCSPDIIQLLLVSGADVTGRSALHRSALSIVCHRLVQLKKREKTQKERDQWIDIAIQMVEKGAIINQALLAYACGIQIIPLAELLVKKGISAHISDRDIQTPFSIACQNNLYSVIRLMMLDESNGIKFYPHSYVRSLLVAIKKLDIEMIKELLPKFSPAHLLFADFVFTDFGKYSTIFKGLLNILYNPENQKLPQFLLFKDVVINFITDYFGSPIYANLFNQNVKQVSDLVINVPELLAASKDIGRCFEVALLLNHITLAKDLFVRMSEITYQETKKALEIKYGKSSNYLHVFGLQVEYEINQEHFKKSFSGEIAPKPTAVNIDGFLELFDKINFTNPDEIATYCNPMFMEQITTVKGVKKHFSDFIEKIKNRVPEFGPPDEQKRTFFYDKLESMCCRILQKLQELSKDSTSLTTQLSQEIIELIQVPYRSICDIGVYNGVLKLFLRFVRDIPLTYPEYVYASLADLRQNIMDSILPQHNQTVHDSTRILQLVGSELGLPTATEMNRIQDRYTGDLKFDIAKIKQNFFTQYNDIQALLIWVKDALSQTDSDKSLLIEWEVRNIPVDFLEDKFAPIREKVAELKGDRDAIEKYFAQDDVDIMIQKNMTPLQAIEDERRSLYLTKMNTFTEEERLLYHLSMFPIPVLKRLQISAN